MTITATADQIEMEDAYAIKVTTTGPRCGNRDAHRWEDKAHHANVASVKACYALTASMKADADAEAAIERSYVRHLEDLGYWEARAQEDYEARIGVVPFDQAMREAGYTDENGWG